MLLKSVQALLIAALLVPAAKAGGDETVFLSPAYGNRVLKDIIEVPTKPFHWDKTDWTIAGSVIGATGLAFIADRAIADYYRNGDHRSGFLTSLSDVTTHFGDYKMQVPLIMGIWVTGLATDDKTMKKIAGDATEASLIAAGVINPAIVYLTGRALPCDNMDPYKFEPFTPRKYSFPSGHTTAAFALATVLDQNLRSHYGYWQTPILFAMASGTAVSRVYDQTHYISDVIFGAGVGWAVGYWVSNKPRSTGDSNKSDKPTVQLFPSLSGMTAMIKF